MIIHVMGASGSGTTSLGEYLADKLDFEVIESDFYKWEQTIPEFQVMRDIEESNRLLMQKIKSSSNLIISGSLHSNPITFQYIDLIIYLKCPTKVRMERILKRDRELGRNSLECDGEVKENFLGFLYLARNYNHLGVDKRSKRSQKVVIKESHAPVIYVNTNKEIYKLHENILKKVKKTIKKLNKSHINEHNYDKR